jgi:hypothetical protein
MPFEHQRLHEICGKLVCFIIIPILFGISSLIFIGAFRSYRAEVILFAPKKFSETQMNMPIYCKNVRYESAGALFIFNAHIQAIKVSMTYFRKDVVEGCVEDAANQVYRLYLSNLSDECFSLFSARGRCELEIYPYPIFLTKPLTIKVIRLRAPNLFRLFLLGSSVGLLIVLSFRTIFLGGKETKNDSIF